MTNQQDPFVQAMKNIEARFGVPFWEYMKVERSPEVQEKINQALQQETLYYASMVKMGNKYAKTLKKLSKN